MKLQLITETDETHLSELEIAELLKGFIDALKREGRFAEIGEETKDA